MIVHENGEIIDNIENRLNEASDFAKKGEGHLNEAKEEQKQAKGKQWWLCKCCFMAMIVVLGPLIMTSLSNMNFL